MPGLVTFEAGGSVRSPPAFVGVMRRRISTMARTENAIALCPGWWAVRLIGWTVIVRLLRGAKCLLADAQEELGDRQTGYYDSVEIA